MRSPSSATEPTQAGAAPWAMPPPWLQAWQRSWLTGDGVAGIVVAVMLVPQSLAYAMLAGLPPQAGLLASLLPLLGYAAFGNSRAMSVGPAAITSLMLGQSLLPLAAPGGAAYAAMAALVALGSGVLLLIMGRLRMGFLSQLLSRPVVQGFTVASAILILLGQMAPLLGSAPWGHTLPQMASSFIRHAGHHALWSPGDALIGIGAAASLWLGMPSVRWIGGRLGWGEARTQVLSRLWPMVVLVLASVAGWAMTQRMAGAPDWSPQRVGVVSIDPAALSGLWSSHWPSDPQAWAALIMPTLMITLVGFVSSVAVAQTFALRHGERVDANRELLGLGAANIGAAVLGGMPVAGGLSRSVVNEAAGARSPLSGVITALLLGACLWPLLPWMAWLPRAALAAIIIVGIASLIEFQALKAAWRYDKAEGWAFLSTAIGVLLIGFEAGILLGLAWSMGAMVWRHSQPHVVEVGRLPGTEHFRNVERYHSETLPGVLMVRIDESLDFTNILRVEQRLIELMSGRPAVRHVVLMLSAVNHIDHSAAQALMELDAALAGQGRQLYLSEIKGPVIDRLQTGGVAQHFRGRMFLNGNEAWHALRKVIEAELIS